LSPNETPRQVEVSVMAIATGSVDRSLNREERRAEALAKLREKIEQNGGHVVITTAALANELGVPVMTVRGWMSRWVQEGLITTKAAGRRGTIVRLGEGRPRAQATGGRVGRAGVRRAGGAVYCVWCGTQSRYRGARFCARCGKPLPKER
jgi:hypothetical protein